MNNQVDQAPQEAIAQHLRPSVIWQPKLTIDGNQWCALYGQDLLNGVSGFGSTPESAMLDFDAAWVRDLEMKEDSTRTESKKFIPPLLGKWYWTRPGRDSFYLCASEGEAHTGAQFEIDESCDAGEACGYTIGLACHPLDSILSPNLHEAVGCCVAEEICLRCDDELGAEEFSFEITINETVQLGRIVMSFLRQKSSINWYGVSSVSSTHTHISGSNGEVQA